VAAQHVGGSGRHGTYCSTGTGCRPPKAPDDEDGRGEHEVDNGGCADCDLYCPSLVASRPRELGHGQPEVEAPRAG
jgi:hypothetical protein